MCHLIPTSPRPLSLALSPHPSSDDYGNLLLAEALLEECLQESMALLRSSTPLTEKDQPKLAKAKAHLNAILHRGRLEVSLKARVNSAFTHSASQTFLKSAGLIWVIYKTTKLLFF